MNRELRFKAWNGKELISDLYLGLENELKIYIHSCIGYEFIQFTGVEDKNGVDIYENYIVKHENLTKNYLVKYDIEEARYYLHNDTVKLKRSLRKSMRLEVIGNIYQNPELLNYT